MPLNQILTNGISQRKIQNLKKHRVFNPGLSFGLPVNGFEWIWRVEEFAFLVYGDPYYVYRMTCTSNLR